MLWLSVCKHVCHVLQHELEVCFATVSGKGKLTWTSTLTIVWLSDSEYQAAVGRFRPAKYSSAAEQQRLTRMAYWHSELISVKQQRRVWNKAGPWLSKF